MLKKILTLIIFGYSMSTIMATPYLQNAYENDPRYLKAEKALGMKDYVAAEKLILEMSTENEFGARALRSLAEIKMQQNDYESAYAYANRAYQKGDMKSGPIAISSLLKKNEFGTDRFKQLLQRLDNLVYEDPLMADNAIILFRKLGKLGTGSGISSCLDIVRHMPLEVLLNSGESIKFLVEYSYRLKIEDKILLSYLLKNMSPALRESELKNLNFQPMALPPMPSYADAINFNKEADKNINPLMNISGPSPARLDVSSTQFKTINWNNVHNAYEIMMQHPEYQLLGLLGLTDMAFDQKDFGRLEQLSELTLRCGMTAAVTNLLIALIHNDKLAKARQYEPYLLAQAMQPTAAETRFTQALLVKYSLITDNKQLFLDWARRYKWSDMLYMEGLRKLIIEGLEKWGEPIDQSLLDYLRKTPARSPVDFNWPSESSKINQGQAKRP